MSDSTKQLSASGRPKPPAAGMGRPKGAVNKLTKGAREAFQHAFNQIGGADQLASWAKDNETEFYKLFARLIPVQTELTGKDGGPVQTQGRIDVTNLSTSALKELAALPVPEGEK